MKRTQWLKKNTKPMKRSYLRKVSPNKVKKPKSHDAGWWQKKADSLLQDINRASGGHCEVCGGENQVLHHYITKALSSFLRYEFKNGIKLCRSCHFTHHFQEDAHIMETVERKRGSEWVDWIEQHRRLEQMTGVKYYREMCEKLEKELFALQDKISYTNNNIWN